MNLVKKKKVIYHVIYYLYIAENFGSDFYVPIGLFSATLSEIKNSTPGIGLNFWNPLDSTLSVSDARIASFYTIQCQPTRDDDNAVLLNLTSRLAAWNGLHYAKRTEMHA